ncbi:YafY family protein [Cetobacterium somerae]|uniref:helix-turn-helix transcriptional regulator n=2 Tax=Cetobacterium TaxID=180162 RepID=UPI002250332C|nr:YafY family protein [Cetobacterium somerae]MCX3068357.1 YafY family protein [Cetobacterium somerae]
MKINRVFEILYILLNREKISSKELAEKFEVSVRTIYRDIEIISGAGIPIFMTQGRNGGISLLQNFTLNKQVLTENEKKDMLIAIQSLNSFNKESAKSIFSKLSSLFGENQRDYIKIDYSGWENTIEKQFELSKEAILLNKRLSFNYISTKGEKTYREVEPYVLWFKSKAWYLKCFCLEKNEIRLFRLSRITNIRILDENINLTKLDEAVLIEEKKQVQPEKIKIKLKIDSSQEYRVKDDFLEQDISYDNERNLIVTLNVLENEWLYGYILSYGSFATVIEPEYIVENIKKRLQKNLSNYL